MMFEPYMNWENPYKIERGGEGVKLSCMRIFPKLWTTSLKLKSTSNLSMYSLYSRSGELPMLLYFSPFTSKEILQICQAAKLVGNEIKLIYNTLFIPVE